MSHSDDRATSILSDAEIREINRELDISNAERHAIENAVTQFKIKPFFNVERRYCIDKRGTITEIVYGVNTAISVEKSIDVPKHVIVKAREIAATYTAPLTPIEIAKKARAMAAQGVTIATISKTVDMSEKYITRVIANDQFI